MYSHHFFLEPFAEHLNIPITAIMDVYIGESFALVRHKLCDSHGKVQIGPTGVSIVSSQVRLAR